MKGIYRFSWNCGRSGDLDSIFLADSDEVAQAVGREVNFGQVLGEHSEIHGVIGPDDISLVSDNASDTEMFERLELSTGYNPLDYFSETDEDEDEAA